MTNYTPLRYPFFWVLLFTLLIGTATLPIQAQEANGGDPPGDSAAYQTLTKNETNLYLPMIARQESTSGTTPPRVFNAIPIVGQPVDRPAAVNPDMNLAIRDAINTTGVLDLVDIDGPSDQNAPQLIGLFQPARVPTFTTLYQVYDWDWSCNPPDGCRGEPIQSSAVTLVAMATTPGEAIHIPSRDPQIFVGGYKALVLYADANQITLGYTREDTPAIGYLVHLDGIRVDPALLMLYQAKNAAGRSELPALRNNEPFATAVGKTMRVAIRDTGAFRDPRSRKDWWQGFVVSNW